MCCWVSRWAKLRINMLPGTVVEPISECFVASLLIGWAAHHVFRSLTLTLQF